MGKLGALKRCEGEDEVGDRHRLNALLLGLPTHNQIQVVCLVFIINQLPITNYPLPILKPPLILNNCISVFREICGSTHAKVGVNSVVNT